MHRSLAVVVSLLAVSLSSACASSLPRTVTLRPHEGERGSLGRRMGGIALTVTFAPSAAAAVDASAMHRALWSRIEADVRRRVRSKDGRSIVASYLAMESWDGLRDGSWWARTSELGFTFGDSAGVCVREMYVSAHFVEMVILDLFPELAAIARGFGASLVEPRRTIAAQRAERREPIAIDDGTSPALREALADGQERVTFSARSTLVSVATDPEATLDTRIELGESEVALRSLPAKEREAVLDRIRRGACACEVCESIRAERGMGSMLEVARPQRARSRTRGPKSVVVPQPRHALLDAPVHVWPDAKAIAADPAGMVVVDFAAGGRDRQKPRASVLSALASCPVRGLSFQRQGMRGLWPEVLRLTGLELLSLNDVFLRTPLRASLGALSSLRYLDLRGSDTTKILDGLELPPELEILDVWARSERIPDAILRATKLRTLEVSGVESLPEVLYTRPIDTLSLGDGVAIDPDGVRALPLRFASVRRPETIAGSSVEFLAMPWHPNAAIPESIRTLPKLRALHLVDALTELPEWLPEVPELDTLFLSLAGIETSPSAFRALERMPRLRILVLDLGGATAMPLDLSACRALEVLALHGLAATTLEALPRGLVGLPKLRATILGSATQPELARAWSATVPSVRSDDALRYGEALDYHRMSRPLGTPEQLLARFSRTLYTDLLAPGP